MSLFSVASAVEHPHAREDPEKIKTAEACGECHAAELEVWKKTSHATGFKTLHRKEQAEQIAGNLGVRLMKRDSPCLACHYTPTLHGDELRAVSGVSCESCHGAGADWINVHNDYGGKDSGGKSFDHDTETPEHRARRIEESRALGMRRPSDLYPVVKSCFGCHLVPNEDLVNVGRHSIGSGEFEFVRWSQGEIRHNFLASLLEGGGAKNAERPLERRRIMYVVGRAVELESSLRGVAAASGEGVFLKAMIRRVRLAVAEVRALAEEARIPEMKEAVALVGKVRVGLGQTDALGRTADEIGELTRRFLREADGRRLALVDPLLEGKARLADAVPVPPPEGGRRAVAGAAPADRSAMHPTIGPGACGGCHGPQNQWWFRDNHFKSAEPFFEENPENLAIARRYGVPEGEIARGSAVCMTCHGTVVTGREQREAQDGVSCESCHGAAGDYLEPHKKGEKSLGTARPGYVEALKLGMIELADLEVRARNCTSCHYVTDEKLLAAGHPSGEGFDFAAGMAKVRHWEDPPAPAESLAAAFRKVLDARGPVPRVEVAKLPPPEPEPEPAGEESDLSDSSDSSNLSDTTGVPAAATRVVGEVKTRIRPASRFGTVGPTSCSGCHRHQPQSQWWTADAHYRSADPFFEDSPKHLKIARLYGIPSREMTRGTQVCMDCHGTIITGKEKRPAADGVGCESCHGPAAAYLEPHQEGDKALGLERPGYVKALTLGMKEVRRPEVAARSCTDCHYVTEPRLLSAGHPSGADFDYLGGMAKVKHWDRDTDTAALAVAVDAELGGRGKVPAVRVASRGDDESTPVLTTFEPRPYEVSSAGEEDGGTSDLPPFPQVDESLSVEEVLLLVKKRFELLYRKVRESPGGGSP